MINIAICDDDEKLLEGIASGVEIALRKYYDGIFQLFKFNNSEDLLRICRYKRMSAIFLDISMPELDGFEAAKQMPEANINTPLIFVSGNESMVYASYEYHPFWFIPKSQLSWIEQAISRLVTKIKLNEIDNKPVTVKMGKMTAEIDLKKVTYFKNDDHYIRYYDEVLTPSKSFRCKLAEIEEQLEKYYFVRCHNRYLVNCRAIASIEKASCILVNGEKIPVSRSCMAKTKEAFLEYSRGRR